jgi:arylsulfatase A-like enzyme
MKKNPLILQITCCLFYLIFLISCQESKEENQSNELPNIILLMGDDHGWDETGYNGHPYLHTPVLDEMATQGLRMDRFYSASPTCSPTRGSIITGRHPNRYGTFSPGFSIRPEEVSIAQIMKQAGYTTAHFGKWHLGPVKADSPTNPKAMGFDEYLSHDNFFEMNPHLSRNGNKEERYEGESSEILITEAIQFIKTSKDKGMPFFVVIWYGSPHEPYSGLSEDLELYKDLPKGFGDKMVKLTSNETGYPVERLQRDVLKERFAEITAMDRSIGTLRDYLRNEEIRDNTLLWYFGDNGTPKEGNATVPFKGEKGDVYEGGIRVPSVLEWPVRIPQPMFTTVNAVSTDLLPTVCAIVGQSLPDRPLDGINLLPLFDGKMVEREEPIRFWNGRPRRQVSRIPSPWIILSSELQKGTSPLVKLMDGINTRDFKNFHHPDIQEEDFGGPRAILDNRYKLVIHGEANSGAIRELYDVREDPAEKNNLIDIKVEIANELETRLRTWQESVLRSLMGEDYPKK